jgi:tripartite-type tricarboxylate transporter receptor subunit TctC
VRADSPYKKLQDLFDAAKKAPGTIRAATTGILSDDHLAILMAEEAVPGATYRIVHLEGGAAQFKEIMAGNIDVAFDNVGSIVTRVRSGEVRALAVMDDGAPSFCPTCRPPRSWASRPSSPTPRAALPAPRACPSLS